MGISQNVVKQPVVVHPVPLKKDTVQISKEQDSHEGGLPVPNTEKYKCRRVYRKKTNKVKAQPEDTQKVFVEYPQVKNGAYEIVGTQEEHRMRSGETFARFGIEILRLERFYSLPGGV